MSLTPSMSLFLNYASTAIEITAKAASLLFTVSGNMDHGPRHGFLDRKPMAAVGGWTLSRPSKATQTPEITRASMAAQATHISMAPGSPTAHRHQHGGRLLQKAQEPDTTLDTRHSTRHSASARPLISPWPPRGSAGHSHQ